MNYSLGNSFFRSGIINQNQEFNYLKTDIYEKDNTYYLKIEIPGANKEDISIDYENGYLTVSVTEDHTYEDIGDYIRKERITSEKERTFYVGEIKEESIKACFENGILNITLEKKEEQSRKRQIVID